MDQLEYAKAKQLRQIAESRETTEPVADFTVKKFADDHITVAAEGCPIEIAALILVGLRDIEKQRPEARIIFTAAVRAYLEG